MAALFRIAVFSAIFYLARFDSANQRKRSDSAYSQKEDSWSASEGSSEKILIKSGVPLRGRTIHHTAWSEEDKEPDKGAHLQQATVEKGEKKFYDSWSLTKAFNYILSFIYDMEDDPSILVHTSPGNSNDKSKLQKGDFDDLIVSQAIEHAGNVSMYNDNQDSLLESTPGYLLEYFQNQGIEWFENGFDNEDKYSDYQYKDNELLYEDADSEYEVELSRESDDDGAINEEQSVHQFQDMNSKIFIRSEYETEKTSERKRLPRIEEKESSFNAEHVLHKSRESEQEDGENAHNKLQEEDLKSDEDTKSVPISNNRVHETRNETKVVKKTIYHFEKSANEHLVDTENSSINTNQESSVNEIENTKWREYKTNSEKKPIEPKNQDNKISSSETDVPTLKPSENYSVSKRENSKFYTELENHGEYETKPLKESKTSIQIGKKGNSLSHIVVSNDIKNDSNEDASSDINYLEKITIKSKPSTSNTHNERHPQMEEENSSIKVKISDLATHGYSQPQEEKRIVEAKPPTSVTQRYPQHKEHSSTSDHPQHKEQSSKSDHRVQNQKTIAEHIQGWKLEDIQQNATTEHSYEKVLKEPTHGTRSTTVKSFAYTKEKMHQSRIHGNKDKERVELPQKKSLKTQTEPPNLTNIKPLKKPSKDRDAVHLKPKMKMLSDLYIDLEPDENIGSYNYLLDSFEFIRVNEVNKKQSSSAHVFGKDEKRGAQEKATSVLLESRAAFKHKSEPEVPAEPHEGFETILEYLYKNSNNSFLLSLKEYNSSVF